MKTQLCCRIDLHLVQRWKLAYTTVVDCVVAVLRGGCHDHDGAEIATCAGRARSSCCMPPSRQASRRPSAPHCVETINDAALPYHLSTLLAVLAAPTLKDQKMQVWKMKKMKNG